MLCPISFVFGWAGGDGWLDESLVGVWELAPHWLVVAVGRPPGSSGKMAVWALKHEVEVVADWLVASEVLAPVEDVDFSMFLIAFCL